MSSQGCHQVIKADDPTLVTNAVAQQWRPTQPLLTCAFMVLNGHLLLLRWQHAFYVFILRSKCLILIIIGQQLA